MRRFRARTAAALAAAALVGLAGCGDSTDTAGSPTASTTAGPITVESCGRKVTFDSRPKRVLAIGSEAPSLLVAAGAGDALAGYAGALDGVPFGAADKAAVERANYLGANRELPVETMIGAGVDVVIASSISSSTDITALTDRLGKAGVQLLTVSGYCADLAGQSSDDSAAKSTAGVSGFDLIYRDIETYGRLFGTEQAAATSVDDLRKRVEEVKAKVSGRARERVIPLFVYADGPLGSYGNQAIVAEQMGLLGVDDVFGDVAKRYFEPNVEQIVNSKAAKVIALYLPDSESKLKTADDVIAELRSRPDIAKLGAITADGGVLPLNYYYTSPSPLAVDGLERLADQPIGGGTR